MLQFVAIHVTVKNAIKAVEFAEINYEARFINESVSNRHFRYLFLKRAT